ncbi:unnamed protein product [Rotaria sp. Silwood1]|nr:unnamed protein product [Rotaria sp. Silwood1]CAF4826694.1 unnamed protein product [Rotaria sp. Silwood1]
MSFYGSTFSNETLCNDGRQIRPARHIACPQHIKDGYIPYVEDSAYVSPSAYENPLRKTNRFGLCIHEKLCIDNITHDWRQELIGLAQQVQSSLSHLNESHQSRSSRSTQYRSRRGTSSVPIYHLDEDNEQNNYKKLLNRRPNTRHQFSPVTKSKISISANEQESSTNNENQDSGIWLLPILCHILHVDNINEAQDWLVNANVTEKRLAMELISRTMQDMQNHENLIVSDKSICDQSPTTSNLYNLYWPYKFWQHQQQSKLIIDNNDTCERATSPVRILTPAKRLSTSTLIDRVQTANERASTATDRSSTASIFSRSNPTPQKSSTPYVTETWRPYSRFLTPMSPNTSDRSSRRSHRITTSKNVSTDNDNKPISANLHGKNPLI